MPTDTTNPQITFVGLTNVDVTDGGVTVPFSAGALDTGSGVDRVVFTFDHSWQGPGGLQNSITFTDSVDSFSDGTSALSVFFGQQSSAETYTITSAQVYDLAGNLMTYSATDLLLMGLPISFMVANRNLAPTATVTAPAYLVEDRDTSGAISIVLSNVSQFNGTVTVSFDAAHSTVANGSDVNVSTFLGNFNVNQPSGSFTITVPPFSILQDQIAEGTELIALTIHVPGQIFSSGTDTITVTIPLVDSGQTGTSGNDILTGTAFDDQLRGFAGNDILHGLGGNDFLDGGPGADIMDGGDGDDRIVYDPADNPAQVTGGAGYDVLVVNDMAAPTNFNLAAQGFEAAEVTQTDSGNNNPWSTILQTYSSSWQLMSQDVRWDDNSRTYNGVDWDNTKSWNQLWYNTDALGRFTSEEVRWDDGTRTWTAADTTQSQSWSQVWLNFDAQNRFTSEDVHWDDGARTWTVVDVTNSQSWTQQWLNYDVNGQLTSQDVHWDNGTRTWTVVDVTNSQTWNQQWLNYDTQNRLVSMDVHWDNGTRTWTTIDADNSQSWAQQWFNYDAQGRFTNETVNWDDGTRTWTVVDTDGSQNWSQQWLNYDAQGRLSSQDVHWDDGTRTWTVIDINGSETWSQEWFNFDAQGQFVSENVAWDDGTRTWTVVDVNNQETWSQQWLNYDIQNRLDTQHIIYDDGSQVYYNFDQAGSEPFIYTATSYHPNGSPYQMFTAWDDGTTTTVPL